MPICLKINSITKPEPSHIYMNFKASNQDWQQLQQNSDIWSQHKEAYMSLIPTQGIFKSLWGRSSQGRSRHSESYRGQEIPTWTRPQQRVTLRPQQTQAQARKGNKNKHLKDDEIFPSIVKEFRPSIKLP